MISPSTLRDILTELKTVGVNVLRYKSGDGDKGEELEIIIPSPDSSEEDDEKLDKVTPKPTIRLMGFSAPDKDEDA